MENFKENVKEKIVGLNFKKIAKVSLISLATLGIVGGGAGYAYKKYDDAQEAKARAAQTTILKNQAAQENISLKSESDVKNAISSSIGVDLANITFEEINLVNSSSKLGNTGVKGNNRGYNKENVANNTNVNTTTSSTQTALTSTEQSSTDTTTTSTQNTQSAVTTTSKYFYAVELTANSLEYKAVVDAQTGKILSIKVDNR